MPPGTIDCADVARQVLVARFQQARWQVFDSKFDSKSWFTGLPIPMREVDLPVAMDSCGASKPNLRGGMANMGAMA